MHPTDVTYSSSLKLIMCNIQSIVMLCLYARNLWVIDFHLDVEILFALELAQRHL